MNRKLYAMLGLLLILSLALAGCPAPAPGGGAEQPAAATPAEGAAAGAEATPAEGAAAPAEGVVVRAMLGAVSRDFDTAAVEYCAEETGYQIEVDRVSGTIIWGPALSLGGQPAPESLTAAEPAVP